MYKISKKFEFSASHQLLQVPEDHPCHRLHGHNYVVTVVLVAGDEELDEFGFVEDYRKLNDIKTWLDTNFDHRHLNDILLTSSPTAEFIAFYLFTLFKILHPKLVEVSVSETPKTEATYRPSLSIKE